MPEWSTSTLKKFHLDVGLPQYCKFPYCVPAQKKSSAANEVLKALIFN